MDGAIFFQQFIVQLWPFYGRILLVVRRYSSAALVALGVLTCSIKFILSAASV